MQSMADHPHFLRERLESIRYKITESCKKSSRSPEEILLLAVTKTWPVSVVEAAYRCGLRYFGENYIQESCEKIKHFELQMGAQAAECQWHFIGHLQTNKVKYLQHQFEYIHSVDRLSLLESLNKHFEKFQSLNHSPKKQKFFFEVNVAQEQSKSGTTWGELESLIEKAQRMEGVQISGLMIMPPLDWSRDQLKRVFSETREKRDQLQRRLSPPHSLKELSMGTSHDYTIAIEEGSTLVRLGTALFGERQ